MKETIEGFEFNIRTLGPFEAKVMLSAEEARKAVLDIDFAEALLGDRMKAVRTLSRLERKGWLRRVGHGRYVSIPASTGYLDTRMVSVLATAASFVEPSYVGWWAAASHLGLTWQHPTLVHVAALKQVKARLVENAKIEFVKLKPEKFFGFIKDSHDGFCISSVAKTVVDCVDRPDLSGGYAEVGIILGNGVEKSSVKEIVDAALRNGSVSMLQRLGFFLDHVRPDLFDAAARHALRSRIPRTSRSRLGREGSVEGDFGYQSEWQLQVNINRSAFMGEVDRFGVGHCRSSKEISP